MNGRGAAEMGELGSGIAVVSWGKVLGICSRVGHAEVTLDGTDEGRKR